MAARFIYPAMDELRPSLQHHGRFVAALDTPLFGSEGCLDSLNLVSLVVAIEERIAEETGREIRLVSEKSMSRKNSPFETVGTLCRYLQELMAESSSDA